MKNIVLRFSNWILKKSYGFFEFFNMFMEELFFTRPDNIENHPIVFALYSIVNMIMFFIISTVATICALVFVCLSLYLLFYVMFGEGALHMIALFFILMFLLAYFSIKNNKKKDND